MLFTDKNSIYESHMGYPVYYYNNHGYLPPTPPYSATSSQWESSHSSEFTKSEQLGITTNSPLAAVYPPLVYPQFPTPPLSVSPELQPYSKFTVQLKSQHSDSFQIQRLLNLDCTRSSGEDIIHRSVVDQTQPPVESMRTASVIMKIEDQRVFHVDSTTTLFHDDEDHHQCSKPPASPICPANTSIITTSQSANEETSTLFVCKWEKCYKVFCHLNDLAGHVTQAHGSAPMGSVNYFCKWEGCPRTDRGFNARYKMLVHIRTHTKEKPHQCPECYKCFSRAENLKIHIRSHSGEKPYVCPVEGCNKAYSNSSDRFKHTRTHAMTKPYHCKVPGCNKRYTDPSSLRKHVKTYKHKSQSGSHSMMMLMDEEESMQERITSTSDEVDERRGYNSHLVSPPPLCSSIDQQMTDLDIHGRSPSVYCYGEKVKQHQQHIGDSSYEERLKMYRLGAIFNVNSISPPPSDRYVSSSRSEFAINYSSNSCDYNKCTTSSIDLDAPLDLSLK